MDGENGQMYNTTMYRKSFVLVALISLTVLAHSAVQAAVISQPDPKQPTDIRFAGPIESGDGGKLRTLLTKLQAANPNPTGPLASVYFDSKDGDLGEALEVGEVLRKFQARTVVAAGKSCIGPCAWAFFGGAEPGRTGETGNGRYLYPGAKLAIRGLMRGEPARLNGVDIARLFTYAVKMDLDRNWIAQAMVAPPGALMHVQTVGQLLLLDIKLASRPALTEPLSIQAVNICNHITRWTRVLYTNGESHDDPDDVDLGGSGYAEELSPIAAKVAVFSQILEKQSYDYDQTKDMKMIILLREAVRSEDKQKINNLYDNLRNIGMPFIDVSIGKTYEVSGWKMVGAGFYTEACLINIDANHPNRIEALLLSRFGVLFPSIDPQTKGFLFRFDRNFKII